MNHQKLISILVAVYKAEDYIERCAVSIFSQTYENMEYVFVDDCSPDNSIAKLQEVIKRYPQRKNQIKIIQNPQNEGLPSVRNIQIENATGDYLLFIDSDDWIAPATAIEELTCKAITDNADIVCYDLVYEFKDKSVYYTFGNRNKQELLKEVSSGNLKSYLVLFFTKRSIYTSNQLIFNPKIKICEDFIMFYKLLCHTQNISYLPKAFYHYFQSNPNSNTVLSLQNINDRIQGIKEVENYMKAAGLWPLIKKELKQRKFETKKEFIVDKRFRNLQQWRNTFPECNFYHGNTNIGKMNRLACLSVALYLDPLAYIILRFWNKR